MTITPFSNFIAIKYWPTWLGLLLLRVLSLLPRPVIACFGSIVGLLFYLLGSSRRQIAYKNISVCFPELSDKEHRRINRQHFCLIGQSALSAPMNWWISEKRFVKSVEITARESYDQAIAQGKNIILLAPHFASMDVAGSVLSRERSMISMYQYSKNQLINEVVKRGRSRFGGIMVERKEPLRKLIRLIRQGHPFYYLPDQDAGRKGVFVPFFHELASTIAMLSKFTSMTDAVVIPCSNRIKPWGQGYEVILGEPIKNFPTGDELADTAVMNSVVAGMIRQMPEQYFWVHKRFKTRPEQSDTKFYI